MEITVTIKDVYGTAKCYPICDKAIEFARIAKTTTLTKDTLKSVKQLGYEIIIQTTTLNEIL